MRHVYLSFLGLGARGVGYTSTVYTLNGKRSSETAFVQAAEVELLGPENFDLAIIVCTDAVYEKSYPLLVPELERLGLAGKVSPARIGEDIGPRGQWRCFEELLRRVEHGDRLTVDMTHGFRSTPIVFSAAIHFLVKARSVSLEAAYYGALEKKNADGCAPIIDMREFYVVNEWAEAMSRLIEDADARKLARVAVEAPGFQTGGLSDPQVIAVLESLTDAIRNVDVNHVAAKARQALQLISTRRAQASESSRILLDLVVDKFACLAIDEPGGYTRDYFAIQLQVATLLLEHKLHMQAYTVMREIIGSIGMVPFEPGGECGFAVEVPDGPCQLPPQGSGNEVGLPWPQRGDGNPVVIHLTQPSLWV